MEQALGRVLDVFFGALDLFRFWVVLYEGEEGVILRLGKYHRTLTPGAHWRLPFRLEELRYVNVRQRTSASWDMSFGAEQNKVLTVSCACVHYVHDVKNALLNLESWTSYAHSVAGIEAAKVCKEFARGSQTSLVDLEENCRVAIALALADAGITLTLFALTDAAYARPYKLFMGANYK